MPVSRLGGGERPLHRVPVQAGLNLCVVGHINVVIVIDKGMTANRVVQPDGRNHEQNSESPGVLLNSVQRTRAGMGLSRHLRCQANRSHSCSLFSDYIRTISPARTALSPALYFFCLFETFPCVCGISELAIGQSHLGERLGLLYGQLRHGWHFLASLNARKQVPVQSIILGDVQVAGGIVGVIVAAARKCVMASSTSPSRSRATPRLFSAMKFGPVTCKVWDHRVTLSFQRSSWTRATTVSANNAAMLTLASQAGEMCRCSDQSATPQQIMMNKPMNGR